MGSLQPWKFPLKLVAKRELLRFTFRGLLQKYYHVSAYVCWGWQLLNHAHSSLAHVVCAFFTQVLICHLQGRYSSRTSSWPLLLQAAKDSREKSHYRCCVQTLAGWPQHSPPVHLQIPLSRLGSDFSELFFCLSFTYSNPRC